MAGEGLEGVGGYIMFEVMEGAWQVRAWRGSVLHNV